jgi:hypothetical protein
MQTWIFNATRQAMHVKLKETAAEFSGNVAIMCLGNVLSYEGNIRPEMTAVCVCVCVGLNF